MRRRSGYALLAIVIMLAVVALMMGYIAAQLMMNRQWQMRREAQMQSLWLARAGLELAAGRLLAADDYRGESIELVPAGTVRIAVERAGDAFRVTSEAELMTALPQPVVRAVNRTYRRVVDGGRVRLALVRDEE